MQYFGWSRRACVVLIGGLILTFAILEVGFVWLGVKAIFDYGIGINFMLLTLGIWILCERGSIAPRLIACSCAVLIIGNMIVLNVFTGKSVSFFFVLACSQRNLAKYRMITGCRALLQPVRYLNDLSRNWSIYFWPSVLLSRSKRDERV